MLQQDKVKILFLCTANACRSQMAEGWARHLKGEVIEPYSAGTHPHQLSEKGARVMAEAGVDISHHHSKSLEAVAAIDFDYVVTVCDSAAEACPVFPGHATVIHHGFDDPPRLAAEETDPARVLDHYRRVRDEIRAFVQTLPEALTRTEAKRR